MISNSKDLEEYGRYNIDIPIRQGYLYRKTFMTMGRKTLRPNWKMSWVIVSKQGLFFFDPHKVEATEAKGYVLTHEKNLQFTDESNPQEKKFQIAITSDVSNWVVVCQNWDEKDLWLRAFKQASEQARETKLKKKGNEENGSSVELTNNAEVSGDDTPRTTIGKLVPDDLSKAAPTVFQMKANVLVKIKEAKELETPDSTSSNMCPYAVLTMEHGLAHTKVEQNTSEPKWKEDFNFQITRLPTDLHVVIFDKGRFGSDDIIGQIIVKVESARAGADKEDWFPIRPVVPGEKSSGKVNMRIECRYDLSTQGKVTFGVPLVDLQARHPTRVLPDICFKCISRLYARNLTTEGLFRVPGNKNRMRAYEIQFDQNPDQDIQFSQGEDEHTIAGLLKLFLRELPEPPIPHALYGQVLQLDKISDKNEKVEQVREIMAKLPKHNYNLLQCMCCLLHRITMFSHINLMKETNLAIVFGAVFAYPPSSQHVSKQQFLTQHLPALSSVCELMIASYADIFNNEKVLDCLVHSQNEMSQYEILVKDTSNVPSYAEELKTKQKKEDNLTVNKDNTTNLSESNSEIIEVQE
ncbi:hypothetical protein ABK040_013483 [Willaertia magna]